MFFNRGVSMKKPLMLFAAMLFFMSASANSDPSELCADVLAQDIIENPEMPQSKNAGRVLQLEEEFRITDDGGDFFFKSPWEIKVDRNGYIYVREKDKLLKFDKEGKFIKNILKFGEGPGEVTELASFNFCGDEIILFCSMRNKIVRIDVDGNLIEDLKLNDKRFIRLLSCYEKKYFVLDFEWKNPERKTGIRDLNHTLFTLEEEGEISPTPHSFPTMQAMVVKTVKGRGSVAVTPITRIHVARAHPQYLYFSHTQDYLIKLFDLATSQVVRTFNRKYVKVKHESQEQSEFLMTEFQNDVQNLFVHEDKLWVLTSTFQEGKGILVDVFNQEGEYLDNFFLPLVKIQREYLGTLPITADGDALFVLEINEDETLAVVKYRIVD
jgi:hypothetical protein